MKEATGRNGGVSHEMEQTRPNSAPSRRGRARLTSEEFVRDNSNVTNPRETRLRGTRKVARGPCRRATKNSEIDRGRRQDAQQKRIKEDF